MTDIKSSIKVLTLDLTPDDDIFNDDEGIVDELKRRLFRLSIEDRTIMLMYIELGSLRAVAKELGVSHTLVYKKIKEIRGLMLEGL